MVPCLLTEKVALGGCLQNTNYFYMWSRSAAPSTSSSTGYAWAMSYYHSATDGLTDPNVTYSYWMVPCLCLALGAACGYPTYSSSEYSDGFCILRSPYADESDRVFAVVGEHAVYASGSTNEGVVGRGSVTASNWLVPCLVNVFYFKISLV